MTTSAEIATPVAKRIEERRPWHSSIRHPVPWEMRTFFLNIDTGRIEVAPDKWFPTPDPLVPGKVQSVTKGKIKNEEQNPQSYPLMEYGDVERLYGEAEKSGESLKIAYARLFGLDALTGKQQARLAVAPDVFAAKVGDMRKEEQRNTNEKLRELQAAAAKARPSSPELKK